MTGVYHGSCLTFVLSFAVCQTRSYNLGGASHGMHGQSYRGLDLNRSNSRLATCTEGLTYN